MSPLRIKRLSEHILSVPERWRDQYFQRRFGLQEWLWYGEENRKIYERKIYEQLVALKEQNLLTADTINAIIGNRSWTRLSCDDKDHEGDKYAVKVTITLGYEEDYEVPCAKVCAACLRRAADAAQVAEDEEKKITQTKQN